MVGLCDSLLLLVAMFGGLKSVMLFARSVARSVRAVLEVLGDV